MKPVISVLTANYNNAKYIDLTIKSVQKQTFSNWELVIIDDCSTDNSEAVIKQFLQDERIKYLKNNRNIGYIKTLKKLIKEAVGDIVGILDSDDALAPTAIEEILSAYQKYSECSLIYTQCYYCDSDLRPVHTGFSALIPEGKTNLQVNAVNAMRTFKKSVYMKTAGYDARIPFAEDIDLTMKLEEVTSLHFIDKPLYYYRVLPKSQTHSFKNTQINRSSTALAKLHAYKRRLDTDIPNLNRAQICEVLFFGIITSFLARRYKLGLMFIAELIIIYPLFLIDPRFYFLIFKKIKKLYILKQEKPLLKI